VKGHPARSRNYFPLLFFSGFIVGARSDISLPGRTSRVPLVVAGHSIVRPKPVVVPALDRRRLALEEGRPRWMVWYSTFASMDMLDLAQVMAHLHGAEPLDLTDLLDPERQ
jgi:hypothetical protein